MIIVIYIYNVNNERYLFFWFDFPEYYLIFVHSDTKVIIGFFNIPIWLIKDGKVILTV